MSTHEIPEAAQTPAVHRPDVISTRPQDWAPAARDLIWPDGTVLPARSRGEDNASTVRAMLLRLERDTK